MTKSLYHIETEYYQLISEIEERQGELTPELEQQLIINETQLQSKSISYLEVCSAKESLNNRIDDEIKRLQELKKSNSKLIDNLKNRLLDAVKLYGNFEVGLTKFGIRKSKSVSVEDVNSLDKEFKTVKVTESANKKAIKEAIERGELVKGCEIVENLNLKIN